MQEQRDPEQEMRQRYRNVFDTAEGRKVLGDILTAGHYGVTLDPDNKVQVSEYNFALVIATKAGVLEDIHTQLGMVDKEQ